MWDRPAFVVVKGPLPPFLDRGDAVHGVGVKLGWIVLDTVSESIQSNLMESHAQHDPEPKLEIC